MYREGSRIRLKKIETCLPAGTGTEIEFSRDRNSIKRPGSRKLDDHAAGDGTRAVRG